MNNIIENERTIINIVSGKGGTGKTLLSAVLADMLGNQDVMVLVVDLDIFVRGLTTLLYFHKKEALLLIEENDYSVIDYFRKLNFSEKSKFGNQLGISRYRSFDVLPSVSRVDEIVNYREAIPDNPRIVKQILRKFFDFIPDKYQIIILDSRAGYDEFISATHQLSNVSICVQEEDVVSRITSENLIRQLEVDSSTPLFRVTNKVRGIKNVLDLENSQKGTITDLGVIPFDMDVMNSFGSINFWEIISRSLYKSALIQVWNSMNRKLRLKYEITGHRISPVVSEEIENRLSILGSKERIFFVYGIVLAIFGISYALLGESILRIFFNDPLRLVSLIIGILGLTMAGLTITNQFWKK